MFTIWGTPARSRFCDGLHRRDFLKVGALGSLALPDIFKLRAQAAPAGKPAARPRSIIYVVLSGGPSHIDMWDLKPGAVPEMRGEFKPIATKLPGLDICEHFPLQAKIADQFTLLRGIRSVENDHFLSEVYAGFPKTQKRPAFGSIVSRLRADDRQRQGLPARALPDYVSLSRQVVDPFEFQRPHYAGAGHAPFRPFGEAVENMRLRKEVTADQLQDRKKLLETLDSLRRDLDHRAEFSGIEASQAKAFDILATPAVRDAFDVSREPDRIRNRYGKGTYDYTIKGLQWDNTPLLQARRLVEAGVPVVTVSLGTWDHHSNSLQGAGNIFNSLRTMLPLLDNGLHALMTDLTDRGLDKDVAVIVLGEFGRTPKIGLNGGTLPGREHWEHAGCALVFGGGLKMGQVIGSTDNNGAYARGTRITFQNIMATIYHVLGIDTDTQMLDFTGRPMHMLDDREPVKGLV